MEKKKLMLHSCCGPCSTSVLERLNEDYNITVFYYNPNIYPDSEYIRRKEEQKKFIENVYKDKIQFIEGDYNKDHFYNVIKGLEEEKEGGARCFECYRFRMLMTGKLAKKLNYDLFATTLTVSPHKSSKKINEIGKSIEEEIDFKYMESDFKKQNGYLRSTQLAREYGMYRQSYCGCEFGKLEAELRQKAKEEGIKNETNPETSRHS